jgi:hypothetical protein
MVKLPALNIKKLKNYVDWQLLLFLILFLNVKLAIKIPAIALIYILQFNFKFGFSFKSTRLPLFYPIIIGIGLINLLLLSGFLNLKYNLVFFSGIGLWVLCILAAHQIKLAVERNDAITLHNTIYLFFLINAIVSIIDLSLVIWDCRSLNPYLYQGMYQKYFIGTGDYIRGITFDVSITNSVLGTLGVIYFLYRKNSIMLLLCMIVLLLTGSNSLNMITAGLLILLFIFYTNREQKSFIVACLALLIVFMIKISPQNSDYVVHTSQKILHKDSSAKSLANTSFIPITQIPDSLLNYDERREKIARRYLDSQYKVTVPLAIQKSKLTTETGKKLFIPPPNINAKPYQEATDTTLIQYKFLAFISANAANLPLSGRHISPGTLPGKAIALKQTWQFLWNHPTKILLGNGIGNFSSKIAFKATNLGLTGGYLPKYVYINPYFMHNHLDVYLNFFSKKAGLHSVINNPNAVYFQLLGEYGLLGLLAFIIYYLGYYLKHYQKLTYGIPVLIFVLGVFFLEYWFEQLSVMVLVELILLLNIKEGQINNTISDAN